MQPCPILPVNAKYHLFDINGKELEQDFLPQDIFLALTSDKKADENRESIRHTLKYASRSLYNRAESSLQISAEAPRGLSLDEATDKFTTLGPLLENHYRLHPDDGKGRYDIIHAFVEERAAAITQEFNNRRRKNASPKFLSKPVNKEERSQLFFSSILANNVSLQKPFEKLPEWMQLLVEHVGAIAITDPTYHSRRKSAGSTEPGIDPGVLNEPFVIMMDPFLLVRDNDRPLNNCLHTLQEELLHNLEELTSRRNEQAMDDAMLRSADAMREAGEKILKKIDSAPAHCETLRLIKKTDPKGGSLMSPSYAKYTRKRISELVVDLFDAENYLRNTKKLSGAQTEMKLRSAFSDEFYDSARNLLHQWLDEAAELKAQAGGTESAACYKQQWLENPFAAGQDKQKPHVERVTHISVSAHQIR